MATKNIKDLVKALNSSLKTYETADKALFSATNVREYEKIEREKLYQANEMFNLLQAMLNEVDEILCSNHAIELNEMHKIELTQLF